MLSLTFGGLANIPDLGAESHFWSLVLQILAMSRCCNKTQRDLRYGSILYCVFKCVFKKQRVHRVQFPFGVMDRERCILSLCTIIVVSWLLV